MGNCDDKNSPGDQQIFYDKYKKKLLHIQNIFLLHFTFAWKTLDNKVLWIKESSQPYLLVKGVEFIILLLRKIYVGIHLTICWFIARLPIQ